MSETELQKTRIVDQLGLTLTPQSTLFTVQSDTIILNAHSLVKYRKINQSYQLINSVQLGKGDQISVAATIFKSQRYLAVAMCGKNSTDIIFVSTQSLAIESTFEMQSPLPISALSISNNERFLLFTTRTNAAIFFVRISDIVQPIMVYAISDILPLDFPYQPRYIIPLNDRDFIIDIGMRGYMIHGKEEKDDTKDGKFTARTQLIELLSGKNCCELVQYKKQDYLLTGTADMRIELLKIENSEYAVNYNQSLDPYYQYNQKFANSSDFSNICDFQTFSQNQQGFSSYTQFILQFKTETSKILPTDSQIPKYGICGFKQIDHRVFCSLRGGLILLFKITTPTQQVVYDGEVYMDSDEEGDLVETEKKGIIELKPVLELIWTGNLNVDEMILQNVSSSSPGSVLAQASAGQEENQTWSDARAQVDVLNLTYGNGMMQCLLYDPVGNQAYAIAFDVVEKIQNEYALLHNVIQICSTFLSVFTLIYLQNVPIAQELMSQVQSQLKSKRLVDNPRKKVSFLSLETGSLAQSVESQLFAGHVPSIIGSDVKQPIHFRLTNASFCWQARRLVTATTDGSIYLLEIKEAGQLRVISSCKILDSVQSVGINNLGTQIIAACTDSIRVLVQNGKFLITQQQLSHKMAQIVKYSPSGANFVVGEGKEAFLYDAVTLRRTAQLSGHNEPIIDICYLSSGKIRDTYFCTGANDGMIYLWDRSGERKGEINGRFKPSSLSPFYLSNSQFDSQLPFVLAAGDGLINICSFMPNIPNPIIYRGSVLDDEGNYVNIRTVLFDIHRSQILIGDSRGRIFSVNAPPPETIRRVQDKVEIKSMIKSTLQLVTQRLVAEQHAKNEIIRSPEQLVLNHQEKSLELSFSPDYRFLAVSGSQGAGLVLIEYLDGQRSCILRFLKESVDNEAAHSEQAFVDKNILIDFRLFSIYQKQFQQLAQRVMEIQLEFEHTTKVEQQRHQKSLDQQNSQAIMDVNDAKNVTEQFKNSAEKEIAQCENELMQLDRAHSQNLQTIELQYREKVQHIESQKSQLSSQISALLEKHEYDKQRLNDEHESIMNKVKSDYDSEINNLKGQFENIQLSMKEFDKEARLMQDTADEDADQQLVEQQNKQNSLIQDQLNRMDQLSAQSGMIRNKFTVISNSTSTFKTNIQACDQTLKTLEAALSDLTKELELAKNEEKERQQSIIEREKHIYELKRQAKELEKHRFVLDYKIKDLRKLIQPREQEIHDLQEQVKEVGSELENYNKAITQMNLENSNLKHQEQQSTKELDAAKNNCRLTKLRLSTLEHDVASIIERHGRMTYYDLRKECEMLAVYGGIMKVDGEQQKADLEKQLHKQFLYQAAKELSEQLKSGKSDVVAENARIIEENTELLKEAAVLRREIQKIIHAPVSQQNTENSKVFQARITAQEAEIKRLQKRIKELEDMEA